MTLDGMHFCFVPAGPFVMGNDEFLFDVPSRTVALTYSYFVSRFPVTVAQWREFVEHSAHMTAGLASARGRDNDPVLVTWTDVTAFCEAMTTAWRRRLPAGFIVTPPSEAEWEKAARGGVSLPTDRRWLTLAEVTETLQTPVTTTMRNPFPRRSYPWGELFDLDKANVESSIGEISAVGCYPTGDSPYGCEDMCGNFGEWTRGLWGHSDLVILDARDPHTPTDTREDLSEPDDIKLAVRGGTYFFDREAARCASRRGMPGRNRAATFSAGFRVVLRSAVAPQP
jgi:formylglycine-generating enzyme required for sulfatase activity